MLNETVRVLVVVDDPEQSLTLARWLAESRPPFPAFDVSRASSLRGLSDAAADVVVLDAGLPEGGGLEALVRARDLLSETPIVLLAEEAGLGLEALRHGAQDCLLKGAFDRAVLQHAVVCALERSRVTARLAELFERAGRQLSEPEDETPAREKSELVSAVSHELRSPISIVKAALDNLREGTAGPMTRPQSALVRLANKNVERVVRLLHNLLELGRLESDHVEPRLGRVALAPMVREAIAGFRLAAGRRDVAVRAQLPPGLSSVRADPEMIEQILYNLLDNAVRYARSRVVVSARTLESPAGSEIELSVSDDGPGIAEDELPLLFDKFAQLRRAKGRSGDYKGTGLGLALCKRLAEKQGGALTVEGRPGEGAVFHLRLAACEPAVGTP